MAYCTKCGTGLPELENLYRYCEHCGTLNHVAAPDFASTQAPARPAPPEPPPPSARIPFRDRWYGLPISSTPQYHHWTAVRALIALNCLSYLWILMRSLAAIEGHQFLTDFFTTQLFNSGSLYGPAVVYGEYWRLLAFGFIHNDIGHLFGNMLILWLLGRPLELICGWANTVAIYLLTILGAGLLSAAVMPNALTMGASGAIFGMAGVLIVLSFSKHLEVPRKKMLWLSVWIILFIATQIPPAVSQYLQATTAYLLIGTAGHIGGFLTGILIGLLFAWSMRVPAPKRRRRVQFGLSGVALAMVMTLMILVRSDRLSGPVKRDEIAEKTKLVNLHPNDAHAHWELGRILQRSGLPIHAEYQYREALRLSPNWPSAQCSLARIMQVSHPEESLELYRRCLPWVSPQEIDRSDLLLALALADRQALENSARAETEKHPDSWESHFWLAQVLRAHGNSEADKEQQIADELRKKNIDPVSR